jgi:hypothetical protein
VFIHTWHYVKCYWVFPSLTHNIDSVWPVVNWVMTVEYSNHSWSNDIRVLVTHVTPLENSVYLLPHLLVPSFCCSPTPSRSDWLSVYLDYCLTRVHSHDSMSVALSASHSCQPICCPCILFCLLQQLESTLRLHSIRSGGCQKKDAVLFSSKHSHDVRSARVSPVTDSVSHTTSLFLASCLLA